MNNLFIVMMEDHATYIKTLLLRIGHKLIKRTKITIPYFFVTIIIIVCFQIRAYFVNKAICVKPLYSIVMYSYMYTIYNLLV